MEFGEYNSRNDVVDLSSYKREENADRSSRCSETPQWLECNISRLSTPRLMEKGWPDDYFDYPVEIKQRIASVSYDMIKLRRTLAVEKELLRQETEEVAILTSMGTPNPVSMHYNATAYAQDPLQLINDQRRQQQFKMARERYMSQMMEVEKLCTEEFLNLNSTRAQMYQLNQEALDWRINNGDATGYAMYPSEVMYRPSENLTSFAHISTTPRGTVSSDELYKAQQRHIRSNSSATVPVPLHDAGGHEKDGVHPDRPWVLTFPGVKSGSSPGQGRHGDALTGVKLQNDYTPPMSQRGDTSTF